MTRADVIRHDSPPLLVERLGKRFGATVALADVTFQIDRGEIFGLLGRNGAGKSTTLDIIEGLRAPDHGRVELFGVDVVARPRAAHARIGVMLQTTQLAPRLRVGEAIALFAALHGRRCSTSALLEQVGLPGREATPFRALSGGERQRLALALALVHEPELLLLDEPTAGLDVHARRELHERLLALRRNGTSVLLTTHQIDEAQRLCDRVAILHHGRIVACAPPSELANGGAALEDALLELTREPPREDPRR